jgi:hypothetical protein
MAVAAKNNYDIAMTESVKLDMQEVKALSKTMLKTISIC